MKYRIMQESDIKKVIPLYIDYYNNHEDGEWTEESTYKRIHQVWSREDSLCLIAEKGNIIVGFAIGYFEQYDDIQAYDLIEIVIESEWQNKGLGTEFMQELELQVKQKGGAMIQLQAVNDEIHERFYGKLEYKDCTNLKIKAKWL